MITLDHISKTFRAGNIETTALNDVSLQIQEGEFVAVMGPSGCGKSTLLNIIGLIENPDSGSYNFNGHELAGLSENDLVDFRKENIGFIFQAFNLIDDHTVFENVELPLVYAGMPKKERAVRVREVLELVDLAHRADHRPGQLSGGQQQRVAVARAVVCDPKLILADEPTGNLDSKNGEEVMQMLEILNQEGTTILMVTHSPSHGERAHRIINMLDGKLVTESDLAEAI